MPRSGPGREEEEDARALGARDRVALVRLEVDERSDLRFDLALAPRHLRDAVDDDDPCVLLHLVLAELLPRLDLDENGAGLALAVENDRIARAVRLRDLAQVPALHGRDSNGPPLHSNAVPLDVAQLAGGPFAENTYVVRRDGASEAVVVDPGWDAAEVRLELARRGARCAAILITHGDLDHIGVVAELAEGTRAPVHIAAGDRARLERPNDFMPPGLPYRLRPWTPDVLLTGDETLELVGITWEVVRIPGHTAHHLAYAADGALFSGDLLFAGSVGRTDRPGDDWQELLASVRLLADRFPPETVVYPGHGAPTTLGRELETNPFLGELRTARQ